MADINQETSPGQDMRHGAVTVGTTAAPIAQPHRCYRGIVVTAAATNSVAIYVGGPTVTAAGSRAGIPVGAGSSMTLPVDDLGDLYAVSTLPGQRLHYLGL